MLHNFLIILKECSTCEETKSIHQIFETSSSFHVKQCTTGKVQFLLFRRFLLEPTKFSFLKFWDFPDISVLFSFFFFVNFFFLFPYVHEIQYNQYMKTHTCSLLSGMPKPVHTNARPIYTNAGTGVMVACVHICICMHITIPPFFPPSLGS